MRFKSSKKDGYQVFAVTGINTVSFAVVADAAARKGLLGFAIERVDPSENQRYYMPGFKIFKSVIPHPQPHQQVSTYDHPVQSFSWDDFTAKPDRQYEYIFHPLKGTPKNLDRSASPVSIQIQTEPLYSDQEHDVFFNRGVASSQAYQRRFGNLPPNKLPPAEAKDALKWLMRDLHEAFIKFVENAKRGDTLLGCFYEFRYEPACRALRDAIERGVDVRIIIDAKNNGRDGQESFPRDENLAMVKALRFPKGTIIKREENPSSIQHNKYLVLLKGPSGKPVEVWTGSTNLSLGGFSGQTNVGHWVRNEEVAQEYHEHWKALSKDPVNADLRVEIGTLSPAPKDKTAINEGATAVFSPRKGDTLLKFYTALTNSSEKCSCITLAFGIAAPFKDLLKDNTEHSSIIFMLLEKKDVPNKRSKTPFIAINASNNVYKAWGSYIEDPVYQWAKETNAGLMKLNTHVSYIHSKFLLIDPLGADPIIITGSANFSKPSVTDNDENMLFIRGDKRVADIYFTEFNRLFNHYYFRSVFEATQEAGRSDDSELFLSETAPEWQKKYAPDQLRTKRLKLYEGMSI
ncbi:phospholipase D-like domain-containing protein [Hyalangium versicolor]|uniref:phospholipase D-like domain-containing protein n=1 Tax=Hyalangium versicolor TaxID=2861190 RepID=UPI001CCAED4D|nr:phospholipase D-like domain-containing protein [Hyalangium versicolor]